MSDLDELRIERWPSSRFYRALGGRLLQGLVLSAFSAFFVYLLWVLDLELAHGPGPATTMLESFDVWERLVVGPLVVGGGALVLPELALAWLRRRRRTFRPLKGPAILAQPRPGLNVNDRSSLYKVEVGSVRVVGRKISVKAMGRSKGFLQWRMDGEELPPPQLIVLFSVPDPWISPWILRWFDVDPSPPGPVGFPAFFLGLVSVEHGSTVSVALLPLDKDDPVCEFNGVVHKRLQALVAKSGGQPASILWGGLDNRIDPERLWVRRVGGGNRFRPTPLKQVVVSLVVLGLLAWGPIPLAVGLAAGVSFYWSWVLHTKAPPIIANHLAALWGRDHRYSRREAKSTAGSTYRT